MLNLLKNKAFLMVILSLLFLCSSLSATKESYKELWEEVQKSESQGLPKSTLKIVEQIYEKAKEENNASQFVKAVIHKMKFSVQVEEFSDVKLINNLSEELIDSKFPIKPILHSILADCYPCLCRNCSLSARASNVNKYTGRDSSGHAGLFIIYYLKNSQP